MKLFVALAGLLAVSSAAVINDPVLGYKEGDRYFYFPGDGDGLLHLVDAYAPIDNDVLLGRNSQNNQYYLFTRNNPDVPQFLVNGDIRSVEESNFDFKKVTVFISHGWNGHGENEMSKLLTEAFLIDDDVNVVVLCWKDLANRNYVTAKFGVSEVGRGLGNMINWLNSIGMSYEKVHLVGFSLGGHLVGNAGRQTGAKVKRITALDPAGPLWAADDDRVVETDGQYVEVIHTNTGLLGFTDPCGDADFYPNGGTGMPGCWLSSCSHGRAYEYMASTVKYNHLMANECESYSHANNNRCTGDLHPMGNGDLQKNLSGIFRVNTARSYPF